MDTLMVLRLAGLPMNKLDTVVARRCWTVSSGNRLAMSFNAQATHVDRHWYCDLELPMLRFAGNP